MVVELVTLYLFCGMASAAVVGFVLDSRRPYHRNRAAEHLTNIEIGAAAFGAGLLWPLALVAVLACGYARLYRRVRPRKPDLPRAQVRP